MAKDRIESKYVTVAPGVELHILEKGEGTIGFVEIILHAFAQNNDLVSIFRSIFFALVDKLRTKS